MITESEIYWITRLSGLKALVGGIGVAFLIGYVSTWFIFLVATEGFSDIFPFAKKTMKILIVAWVLPAIFGLGCTLIPTTKEMCAIKVIPIVANNQEVQEIPKQLADLASEWIEELKPNKVAE